MDKSTVIGEGDRSRGTDEQSSPNRSSIGPMGSRLLLLNHSNSQERSKVERSIERQSRNRRLHYFNMNREEYLKEASDQYAIEQPRIYNRLVRMHQTQEERQQASLSRGWADIILGQERLGDIIKQMKKGGGSSTGNENHHDEIESSLYPGLEDQDEEDIKDTQEFQLGQVFPKGQESSIESGSKSLRDNKARGLEEWNELLKERFLMKLDDNFNYATVDDNPEWDDIKTIEQDRADDYFRDAGSEENISLNIEKSEWETGLQDF